jgi:hypothetical protein
MVQIVRAAVHPHPHRHQPLADQVGLRRLLQPDRHVGLPHRQVQHAFFQDQVDLQIGELLVEFRQAGGQPERPEAGRRGDTQLSEHLFLAVPDPRRRRIQPLHHGPRGVEQKLSLFGQNQPARMAVEQRGVERFLKPADLAGYRRLRQVK